MVAGHRLALDRDGGPKSDVFEAMDLRAPQHTKSFAYSSRSAGVIGQGAEPLAGRAQNMPVRTKEDGSLYL